MTVLVKFQIEIRFFIEMYGNSKLSMTSCPPSSDRVIESEVFTTPIIVPLENLKFEFHFDYGKTVFQLDET